MTKIEISFYLGKEDTSLRGTAPCRIHVLKSGFLEFKLVWQNNKPVTKQNVL